MDVSQLRSFVTVAQTLNFTSAARRNGVPQSTVSRQIDSLEEQLGAQLFYRTRRQVKLTEEGRAFLPYAREILDNAQKGAEAVRHLHEGGEGRLSVAAVSAAGAFLTGCLGEFARRCPNILVDIAPASGGEGLPVANEDPFDFHFLQREMADGQEEYELLPTHAEGLALALPEGHPLTDRPPEPEALQGERFILISEKEDPILYMLAMDLCQSMRFTPHVANCFDGVEPVLLSVAAGLGVSILPVSLLAGVPGVRAVPFDGELWRVNYVAAWKRELLNPAARLFLEVLRGRAEPQENG
ncbi:MAG: LysR family transcriptional regulator [Oscillospiraceae bacterium]|nr:LysR family transcriptional regulator [Oscillospiraceae bacterium]